MLRAILAPPSHMRLDYIPPIQKWHLPVRLHPHLVSCVRRNHIQRRNIQSEFPRFRKLAQTGAEGEEVWASDAGGEVGEGEPEVVDAGGVEAEDVAVVLDGGIGGGGRDEVGEGAAGVVCEFGEEGLGFGFGEGAHDWVWMMEFC